MSDRLDRLKEPGEMEASIQRGLAQLHAGEDRPDVDAVARALYYANRGKAPMEWEQLSETAIVATGRQSFYVQTVRAVYAAMDAVDRA